MVLAMVKAPHHWFVNSPKICRLVDLGLNELKAAMAEIHACPVLLF